MSTIELLGMVKIFVKKRGELLLLAFVVIISGIILYSYFSSGDKNSRDMERYADLLSLSDNLKIFYTKNNTYPLPEDSVSITASGKILTYQGYFGEKVFSEMSIEAIKDPLGDKLYKYLNYYTYTTDEIKQKFQLMAWYESSDTINYNPVVQRTPFLYGQDIGIAIEQTSLRPIQETKLGVDVLQTFDPYSIYINNKSILIGDKLQLINYLANTELSESKSCLDIKKSGWNENGYYYINPLSSTAYEKFSKKILVYCDMESDGGGWTRLYYKEGKENCLNDGNTYNSFMIEKLFTKDFAVSDNKETLTTEGSWILNDVDFKYKDFSFNKMVNVANCKTPNGENWSSDFTGSYMLLDGKLSTLGSWKSMFYGCTTYKNIGDNVNFRIGGFINENGAIHKGEFIQGACNNYSDKDNSITSRWDWNNTRVIWVR